MSAPVLSRLFDPDCAVEAGEQIAPALNHLQVVVLAVVARYPGGCSPHDVRHDLQDSHPTFETGSIRRRLTDLLKLGFVEDTGERKTRTRNGAGARSRVYRVTPLGRRAVAL